MPALVLLADDSTLSLKVIKQFLEKLLPNDYFVLVTSHASIVADIVTQNDVRLVITDLMFFDASKTKMQMQGTDLVRVLRSMELDANIQPSNRLPIICFSGDATRRGTALEAGADLFLAKPLSLEDLRRALLSLQII